MFCAARGYSACGDNSYTIAALLRAQATAWQAARQAPAIDVGAQPLSYATRACAVGGNNSTLFSIAPRGRRLTGVGAPAASLRLVRHLRAATVSWRNAALPFRAAALLLCLSPGVAFIDYTRENRRKTKKKNERKKCERKLNHSV